MMLQMKEELSCSRQSLRSISPSPGVSSSLCHETANLPLLLFSAQRLAKAEMHGTGGCSGHPKGWAWGHLCLWEDALVICKERTAQDTLFPSSERRREVSHQFCPHNTNSRARRIRAGCRAPAQSCFYSSETAQMDHDVVSKVSSQAPAMHSKDLYSVTCHDPNKPQEDEPWM